jgi:hypothetical protein
MSQQRAERRALTGLPGPRARRALWRDRLDPSVPVTFRFRTLDQAQTFVDWLHSEQVDAGAWFAADWRVPQGGGGVFRFLQLPAFPQWLAPDVWECSGSVEIRGRSLPPVTGVFIPWEIDRQGPFSYLVTTLADNTDYSAEDFDDSGWAVANGTFGDQPHTGSDTWPVPTTIISALQTIWLRKHSTLPNLDPIYMEWKADDHWQLWINGSEITTYESDVWVHWTTITPPARDIVVAFKVRDEGPAGSGNRSYAGFGATNEGGPL